MTDKLRKIALALEGARRDGWTRTRRIMAIYIENEPFVGPVHRWTIPEIDVTSGIEVELLHYRKVFLGDQEDGWLLRVRRDDHDVLIARVVDVQQVMKLLDALGLGVSSRCICRAFDGIKRNHANYGHTTCGARILQDRCRECDDCVAYDIHVARALKRKVR